MSKKKTTRYWFGMLAIMGMAGCVTSRVAAPMAALNLDQPAPSPVVMQMAAPPDEGSLFSASAAPLFADPKARQIGDTLTVDIVENTSSELEANTNTSRTSDIDASVEHMLGYMRALEAKNPNLNKDSKGALTDTLLKARLSNNFDGEGTSDRSGSVTASIGARVVQVLPNGNLVIVGRREMKVNRETQIIALSGIVRPMDIDGANRVKSTYLADARIEYYGSGVLADKQQPGWLMRAVDFAWPF